MEEEKKQKLVPVQSINIDGETIKKVFFVNIAQGDKMYFLFESGNVLVMPVYRQCPVQVGSAKELSEDFAVLIDIMKKEAREFVSERKNLISFIREMQQDGMDSE